jgi:hypothetical protein
MDRLICVYRYAEPAEDDDTWPAPKPTYRYRRSEWMAVKPLRADEKFSSNTAQRYADVVVRFTAWWIDGLTVLDILKDEDGRWYDIQAVVEVGYREAMEIDAKLIQKPQYSVTE